METISKLLIKLDPSLQMTSEGSWSNTLSEYSAFNDAGVECEVGEFLYSFLRVLKPDHVLETGTHKAIGASYMGLALKHNNKGVLDTFEFLPEIYNEAVKRIKTMQLTDFVHCHLEDVRLIKPSFNFQFMLLDTEPQYRFNELAQFYNRLDEGGFVFIHDLHRHMGQVDNVEHGYAWPWGVIPKFIVKRVKSNQLVPFHFPTPRGLTGFYKVSKEDYKW